MKTRFLCALGLWLVMMLIAITYMDSFLHLTEAEFSYKPFSSLFYCPSSHGWYSCSYLHYSVQFVRRFPLYLMLAALSPFMSYQTVTCWKECNGGIQAIKPILITTPYFWIPFWYIVLGWKRKNGETIRG